MDDLLIWLAVAFCVSQSATLSGLNLAVFSIGRLHLEAMAEDGDKAAAAVLDLRKDANVTLVTILWGNVGVNVLLTLLVESALAGIAAFVFSTVVITIFGEIIPQAWFTRNALRVAAALAPVLRIYRFVLYPLAWPIGRLLDRTVGEEVIPWFREDELKDVIYRHARAGQTEVGPIEATGAVNFLALDDLPIRAEGEPLDPESVIALPFENGRAVFPKVAREPADPFLTRLAASGRSWAIITDQATGEPRLALDVADCLGHALFGEGPFEPAAFCHHPLITRDLAEPLGRVLTRLAVDPEYHGDDVIDEDLILLWTEENRRIVTGADILGRLLRGIAKGTPPPAR
jgi:metal transporter CNNM